MGSVPILVNQYGSNLEANGALVAQLTEFAAENSLGRGVDGDMTKGFGKDAGVLMGGVAAGGEVLEGARAVGSGVTAVHSPFSVPSASSSPTSGTPCSSPPLSSVLSKAKNDGFASASARADGIPPVSLEEQFAGEDFADNLMPGDDCMAVFEAMREEDVHDAPAVPTPYAAAPPASPVCASRRSVQASATKASHMMDKAMNLKTSKALQAMEAPGEAKG